MKTILVVDDNARLLEIFTRALNAAHYHAIPVQSAEHAFEMLGCVRPDLVITDVTLTGMNGIELCCRMQAHPRYQGIPIILLSGLALDELPGGCTPRVVLQKPVALQRLFATIDGLFQTETPE